MYVVGVSADVALAGVSVSGMMPWDRTAHIENAQRWTAQLRDAAFAEACVAAVMDEGVTVRWSDRLAVGVRVAARKARRVECARCDRVMAAERRGWT